jgi:hypothetical protein
VQNFIRKYPVFSVIGGVIGAPIVILVIGFASAFLYSLLAAGGTDDLMPFALAELAVSFASLAAGWILLCATVIVTTFFVSFLVSSLLTKSRGR